MKRSLTYRVISGALFAALFVPTAGWSDPPDLGPLVLLPGDSSLGAPGGDQIAPAIARGGDQYLMTWQDDRANSQDIFAARVDAAGTPIDAIPLQLTHAAGDQVNPQVAWNGSNWLVAWQSQAPTASYWAAGILAVRISPAGQILDPTPITVIAYQNSSDLMYSLTSDGTNWAVIVEGTSAGEAAIRGVRITPDGSVLDPGGVVVIPETYYLRFGLDLGGMPGEYLLVWNEWRSGTSDDVLAYRLTPALQKIGLSPTILASRPTYETNAQVASNGTDFFVAWNLNDNYLSSDVYGTRVTYAGQVLEPNGKPFSAAGIGYGRDPSVTWDGMNWVASWPNYGSPGLNAGRMSTSGVVLDPGGTAMPALGWGSIAGKSAGGFVAAWSDDSGGTQDVYAAPVAASLAPGSRRLASLGAPRQTQSTVAFNGHGYLVVFLSSRSAGSRVMGQRLDLAGNAIDAEPFEIAAPPAAYAAPSVAWNGSVYLVTWTLSSRIYARRVAADGAMVDPAPLSVMDGYESGVAAAGDVFLVAANNAPANPQYVFVLVTRIRGSDGMKLDTSPVSVGNSFSLHPRVGSFGDRWLVVWEQHPTHDDPHATVMGNFVATSGAPGTAFTIGAGGAYNLRPAIAVGSGTALIAWSDSRNGFNNMDIFARRILSTGAILDGSGVGLSTAPNSQTFPAIGWTGSEFTTLFQDPRNIPYFFDEHLDVYGTRVTNEGVVLDPAGFAVGNDPAASEIQPATAGGNDLAVLGCSVYRSDAPYAAFRIGLRVMGVSRLSTVAETGAERVPRPSLVASPNPSSGSVELDFALPSSGVISLAIFDVTGREVSRLVHGHVDAGTARFQWDGRNQSGARLPAGIYWARMSYPGGAISTKLNLR